MSERFAIRTSVTSALEEELEQRQRRIDELEREKLTHIRELSRMRLDEEKRKAAATAEVQQESRRHMADAVERFAEEKRHWLEQVSVAESKQRFAEEELTKAKELAAELHVSLAAKESEIVDVKRRLSEMEHGQADAQSQRVVDIRGLQSRIDALSSIADQRADEVDAERARTREAMLTAEEYRAMCQRAVAENGDFEKKLAEASDLKDSLRSQLTDVEAKLQSQRSSFDEELSRRAETVRALQLRIDGLQSDLGSQTADVRSRERDNAALQGTLEDAQALVASRDSEIERLRYELDAAVHRSQQKAQELDTVKQHALGLESDLSSLTVRKESLCRQVEDFRTEAQAYQHKIASLEDTLGRTREELGTVKVELRRVPALEQQVRSLQDSLDRGVSDSALSERRLAEARGTMARLQTEVDRTFDVERERAALERELAAQKERCTSLSGNVDRLRDQLEDARASSSELAASVEDLKSQLFAANRSVAAGEGLKDELSGMESKLAMAQGNTEAAERRSREYENQLQSTLALYEGTMTELNRVKIELEHIPRVEAELRREKEVTTSLRNERDSLSSQLDMRKAELERAKDECLDLQAQSTKLQDDADSLRGELSTLAEVSRERDDFKERSLAQEKRISELDLTERSSAASLRQLTSEVERLETLVASERVSREETSKAVHTAAASNNELQIELGRQQVLREAAEKQSQKLRERLEASSVTIAENEREHDRLREELHRGSNAIRTLEQRLSEAKLDVAAEAERAIDLGKRLDDEMALRSRAEQALADQSDDLVALRGSAARVSVLEGKVMAAQKLAADREEALRAVQERLDDAETRLGDASQHATAHEATEERLEHQKEATTRLRADVDRLEDEVHHDKAVIAEKDRSLRDAHSRVAASEATAKQLKEDLESATAYSLKIEAQAAERHRLEGQVRGLTTVVDDLKQQNAELKAAVEQERLRRIESQEEMSKMDALKRELAVAEQTASDQQSLVTAMESEAQKRSGELSKAHSDIAEAERLREASEARLRELERALSESQSDLKVFQDRLTETEALAEDVERSAVIEMNKLHAFGSDAAETVKRMHADREKLIDELQNLQEALEKAKEKSINQQHDIGVLKSSAESDSRAIADLQATVKQVSAYLESEREAHSAARVARTAADAECDAAVAALSRAQREAADASSRYMVQMEELREELVAKSNTISTQSSMIDDLRRASVDASDEARRLRLDAESTIARQSRAETRLSEAHEAAAQRDVDLVELRMSMRSRQEHPVLSPERRRDTNGDSSVNQQIAALDRRLESLRRSR